MPRPGTIVGPYQPASSMLEREAILKSDHFGTVERCRLADGTLVVRRDLRAARWWARGVARIMARRECRALEILACVPEVPLLKHRGKLEVVREHLQGRPLQDVGPTDPRYYRQAHLLLRRMHRLLVTHNDLHKEPNWLVTPDGHPALVDFQLASTFRRRTRWFRLLALEDLRHLLKHKKKYCAHALTARERSLLKRRSWPARWWRRTVKPVYCWITRRCLHWSDREGGHDRNREPKS